MNKKRFIPLLSILLITFTFSVILTPSLKVEAKKLLSKKQCVQIFIKKEKVQKVSKKRYTSKDRKSYAITEVAVEGDNVKTKKDNYYLIHYYEDVFNYPDDGHSATYGWYYVSRSTGKIYDMMGIDSKYPYINDVDSGIQ